MVGAGEPGEAAHSVAGRRRDLVSGIDPVGAVLVEALDARRCLGRGLEPVRLPGRDVDDGADRIARISGGEGAVEDVDPLDLLRRHHEPARAGAIVVVADEGGEEDSVGVDQAPSAGADAGGAGGERRLGVARMAPADEQARQIAHRILWRQEGGGFLESGGVEALLARRSVGRPPGGHDDMVVLGCEGASRQRSRDDEEEAHRDGGARMMRHETALVGWPERADQTEAGGPVAGGGGAAAPGARLSAGCQAGARG
jgi:hypothetical protein